MQRSLDARTSRLLDIQGFEAVDRQHLAQVAPWLRLAYGLCTGLVLVGTITASPVILLCLTPVAALGAALPIHPFDLIYNHGIRRLTGTGALPRRGAPARFACGLAVPWLLVTAWAFSAGHAAVGFALASTLVVVGGLVSTTHVCIPSMLYRALFGWPQSRDNDPRATS
ncbi:MAG TPA: DUF4395 family protein [Polyangiaceae bacterium]|nr:DUF4395 family protein [Polyangiaceae bacterium]